MTNRLEASVGKVSQAITNSSSRFTETANSMVDSAAGTSHKAEPG